MIKQSPNNDPKFHQIDKFEGAGKSTNALLASFSTGWIFRIGERISSFKWAQGGPLVKTNFHYNN